MGRPNLTSLVSDSTSYGVNWHHSTTVEIDRSTAIWHLRCQIMVALFCGLIRQVLHQVEGLASGTFTHLMLHFSVLWILSDTVVPPFAWVTVICYNNCMVLFLSSLCTRPTKIWTQDIWIWIRLNLELKLLLTSNFKSTLYYNCHIWLNPTLKPKPLSPIHLPPALCVH